MDFKSIIYDLIVEEVKNKKLLNALHSKWNSQDDSVTPEITEFIFSRFMGGDGIWFSPGFSCKRNAQAI